MLDFGPASFFLTPAQLQDSPSSRLHGVPSSTERALRFYACEIIQEAGILLRMPQAVMATAQILLHRFYCKQSFKDFDARSMAASCFWLSMKLEEEGTSNRGEKPCRLQDVVMTFDHIRVRREGDPPLVPRSEAYTKRKDELLKLEMRLLVELGFVCHVEHPHKLLLGYLNLLGLNNEKAQEFCQEAWNMVNDSLRSTLCVTFPSNVVACGVIYAVARRRCVSLPENPSWWHVFDATLEQILEVCSVLADLYKQPKAAYVDLTAQDIPTDVAVVVAPHKSRVEPLTTDSPREGTRSRDQPLQDNLTDLAVVPPCKPRVEPLPVQTAARDSQIQSRSGAGLVDSMQPRKDVSCVSLSSTSQLSISSMDAPGVASSKVVFVGAVTAATHSTCRSEESMQKIPREQREDRYSSRTKYDSHRHSSGSRKRYHRSPEASEVSNKHRRRDYDTYQRSGYIPSSSKRYLWKVISFLMCNQMVQSCEQGLWLLRMNDAVPALFVDHLKPAEPYNLIQSLKCTIQSTSQVDHTNIQRQHRFVHTN